MTVTSETYSTDETVPIDSVVWHLTLRDEARGTLSQSVVGENVVVEQFTVALYTYVEVPERGGVNVVWIRVDDL